MFAVEIEIDETALGFERVVIAPKEGNASGLLKVWVCPIVCALERGGAANRVQKNTVGGTRFADRKVEDEGDQN